jgi:dihydrofolate reductase
MKGIVAMSLNRVIGYQGQIPWKIKEDLDFFKKMTSDPDSGGFLIMGRKTFDSVGVLPGRHTYVLTTNTEKLKMIDLRGHKYVNEESLWRIAQPDHRFWICGGAEVYKRFLPMCHEVYVTIVLNEYDGDTYLEPFEDKFPRQKILGEYKTHWIVRYSI